MLCYPGMEPFKFVGKAARQASQVLGLHVREHQQDDTHMELLSHDQAYSRLHSVKSEHTCHLPSVVLKTFVSANMHSEEGAPNGQLVSTICGPDKKCRRDALGPRICSSDPVPHGPEPQASMNVNTIGALILTDTIFGVPYYNESIIYPKTLF